MRAIAFAILAGVNLGYSAFQEVMHQDYKWTFIVGSVWLLAAGLAVVAGK